MRDDPQDIISRSPMSLLQVVVVALTVLLTALDGFDVLSISFAAPGIAEEWGIDKAELGIVLAMELIGMAIGSMVLGVVADKVGRKPTITGALAVMVFGMFMVTTAPNVIQLSVWRVLTGFGIGGVLACTNAVCAEFSNARRKDLAVSVMAVGYPIGAVVGGIIAAQLLKDNDWRSVFYLGSAVTAALIPIVYFFIPESVSWLAHKQPKGALERINRTLRRMKHDALDALPVLGQGGRSLSSRDIFNRTLLATTILVSAACFLQMTTFYFMLKWIPKIVVDMGFAAASAAGVLVWANIGGALGGALFGLLTQRIPVKYLTIAAMVTGGVMVALFGRTPDDLSRVSLAVAMAGFFTNAGIVGLYAIFARVYPTHARGFGTGFSIGIGRGGAMLGPILAGFLFNAGVGLPVVAAVMSLGSLIAAGLLIFVRLQPDRTAAAPAGESGEVAVAQES